MSATVKIEVKDPGMPRNRAVIGSAPGCDIRIIGDPYVSTAHVEVVREAPGAFRICNRGAINKIRVLRGMSEHQLGLGQHLRLVRGDTIIVGRTRLDWSGSFT